MTKRCTGTKQAVTLTLVVLALAALVHCDYKCVCSQHTHRSLYTTPSDVSSVVGFLYQGDCVALLSTSTLPDDWLSVAYMHQITYIRVDYQIRIQVCPGQIPDPVTTPVITSGMPTSVLTTEVPTTALPTTRSSTTDTRTKTQLSTTALRSTTLQPTQYVPTTHLPLTTHLSTLTQLPTTRKPTTAHLVIQAPVSTAKPDTCTPGLHGFAQSYQHYLTSEGNSCYELVPVLVDWVSANNACMRRGGFLVTINSVHEQMFLYKYIQDIKLHYPVWIGLNDIKREGFFEWISGAALIYTRETTLYNTYFKDCVHMNLDGHWENSLCHNHLPFICEYDSWSSQLLSGIGSQLVGR